MVTLGLLPRVLELVASSWSLVLELCEHHKALWSAVRAYLTFAMHPSLLVCSPTLAEEVQPVLKQVCMRVCSRVRVRVCACVCVCVCMSVCLYLSLISLSVCVGGEAALDTWRGSLWPL